MAVLAAAQLLDELMGRNRNTNPNEKTQKLNWEDPQYCKYYMVKFCPHDLFVNTRADLGSCPRIHDDEVKQLYMKAEISYKKTYYQDEFLRFCQNMIGDVERKIQKGKQRLELMNTKSESGVISGPQSERNQEQIKLLTEKIAKLVEEAEQAGIRGDVDQAQGLMKLCDQLKDEKEQLQKQNENSHWTVTAELAAAQEKQMEVCTVCGAFLIVGDAQQRIDDHLMGKQHVGYLRLREAFDEITEEREKHRIEKEKRRNEERDRARGAYGKDRERDRDRDRDRDRERDRDRDRRSSRSDKDQKEPREKEPREKEPREKEPRERERNDKDRGDKDRGDRDHAERDKERERDRGEREKDKDRNNRSHRPSRDEKRSSRSRESRDTEKKHRNDRDKAGGGRERSRDREGRRRRSRSRGR
ncbi:luc7-like protein 3 isoform X2 [Arctopsyche grandis]|uniref:luc7-like protein 3 isoform X2 n=1 Tax=Arctopsyche grandis TaxID=121162 RepID=UPI00406D9F1A